MTRNTQQHKPDKCVFIFDHLTVVSSLQKGAYPENSHVCIVILKQRLFNLSCLILCSRFRPTLLKFSVAMYLLTAQSDRPDGTLRVWHYVKITC